jgi:dipeptidyl aminopeptidase/acylaminoacyl peptidase
MEDYVIENFDYPLGNPQEPLLDTEKVGIMGGSRGGSVVYLAKIRDDYYEADEISRALVTIGSVTDFLLPGANNIKTSCEKYIQYDGYVPEGTYHYYLEDYNVFNRVLEPYLHGEITFTGARKLLVRSSPYHFAEDYLDHFQVHHGDQDQLARVAHTANLYNIFDYVEDLYQIFLYNSEDHSISDVDNSYPPYPVTDNYVGWIHDDFLDKVINGN